MHFMIQGGGAHAGVALHDGKPRHRRRPGTGLGCCCDRGGIGFLGEAPKSKLAAAASFTRPTPPKAAVADPSKKITAAKARAATKAAIKANSGVTARGVTGPDAVTPAASRYADAAGDLYGGDVAPVMQARSVTPAASSIAANVRAATKKQLGRNKIALTTGLLTNGQRLRAAGQNVPTLGQRLRAAGVNVPTLGQKIRAAMRPRVPAAASPLPAVLEQPPGKQSADMVPTDQNGASYEDQSFIDRATPVPVSADVVDQLTPGADDSFVASVLDSTADYGGDEGGPEDNRDDYTDAGDIDEYGDDESDNLYADADADADLYGGESGYEDPTDIGGGAHLSGFGDDAQCRLDRMGVRRCPREEAIAAGAVGTPVQASQGDVSEAAGAVSLWGGNGDDVLYQSSFDTLHGLGLLGDSSFGEKISGVSARAGQVGDIVSRVEALFKGKQKVESAAASVKQHAPAIATTALVIGGVGVGLYLLSRSRGRRRR